MEERPLRCLCRGLISLCSLVWQLKKLEMTQSISQAHKGDIVAHDHGLASVQGICRTSFAHVLARWLIHKRIPQRSLLTAVNNNPTAGSASDSEMQKHFDLLWFVCLFDSLFSSNPNANVKLAKKTVSMEENQTLVKLRFCSTDSKCSQNGKRIFFFF